MSSTASTAESDSGLCLQVKCGSKAAEFFPAQCKKSGRSITKCVRHKGQWMSPTEFETLSGMQGKKWKQNIKFEGKPIGEWLAEHENVPSSFSVNITPTPKQPQNVDDNGKSHEQQRDSPSHNELCNVENGPPQTNNQKSTVSPLLTTESVPCSCSSALSTIVSPTAALDLQGLFAKLENQLSASLKTLISETIQGLWESIESEIRALNERIGQHSHRITELESVTSPHESHSSELSTDMVSREQSYAVVVSTPPTKGIETQVAHLTETISKQQKIIEMNEREKREKNMIIIGLSEGQHENTEGVVKDLFESKLGVVNAGVASCKRLGKRDLSRPRPRPILVVFDTIDTKRRIMQYRSKLAGTSIFLNNDLTKEQMLKEKNLRKTKKELMNHPSFQGKKITIFKGKLWADKQPLTEDEIQTASLSQ